MLTQINFMSKHFQISGGLPGPFEQGDNSDSQAATFSQRLILPTRRKILK